MRKFWAAQIGGSVVVSGGPPGFGSSTYPHVRHMCTDTAGLSSAGAHEFTFNKAADAHCPIVTRQRVERGVGWVEGISTDRIPRACDRSLRTGPLMAQRDSACREESIGDTWVLNGGGLTPQQHAFVRGGVGRPLKGVPGKLRGWHFVSSPPVCGPDGPQLLQTHGALAIQPILNSCRSGKGRKVTYGPMLPKQAVHSTPLPSTFPCSGVQARTSNSYVYSLLGIGHVQSQVAQQRQMPGVYPMRP